MLSIQPSPRDLRLIVLAAAALGWCGAVGHADDNPFAEQLAGLRSLANVRAEWTADSPSSRIRFLAKGRYWNLQEVELSDTAHEVLPDVGCILSESPTGRAYLRCQQSFMILARYAAGSAGIRTTHLHFGSQEVPPLIAMFSFLGFAKGDPDYSRLEWSELLDEALMAERLQQLIGGQRDDGHGGCWVTVPLHPTAVNGGAPVVAWHLEIHAEAVAALQGARVITEIGAWKNDADSAAVNTKRFTYRMVTTSAAARPIPLLARYERFSPADPGTPYDVHSLIAIDCTSAVEDAELEIDPRRATKVEDVSALLVAAPTRRITDF